MNASQVIATVLSVVEVNDIRQSQVLPGLEISLVEEALRRAQVEDDGAVSRWLLTLFNH